MEQIYHLRGLLEKEVLATIRWPEVVELGNIHSAMDEVIGCVKAGDGHGALEAARQVSFIIFDLCPYDIYTFEAKRIWDRAAVYRALELATVEDPEAARLTAYYSGLFAALKNRDREELIRLNSARISRVEHNFQTYSPLP